MMVRARRRFGQHFLEPAWVAKVIHAVAPGPGDVFLEIGPGRGALTRPLAAAAAHVVAVEIDRDLAAALEAAALPRVTVVAGDMLQVGDSQMARVLANAAPPGSRLRAAGNLPYNVASPILFRLIALHADGLPLTDATVMLQREVADRLLAGPGSRDYGVLTVLVRRRAACTRLLDLPPGAFRPAPKVRSTVVRLAFHEASPRVAAPAAFEAVVKAAFAQRRKTIANALAGYAGGAGTSSQALLLAAGIEGTRRPESLEVAEFCRLANAVASPVPTAPVRRRRAVL